ncbi:hypothetical protein WDZ92_49360, partial [Nostoc sp. NIES-2111]
MVEAGEFVVGEAGLGAVGLGGGGGCRMDGDDGGVELVGTGLFAAEGGLQDGEGGGDFVGVPESAILLVEGDEVALGVEAGIAAGVGGGGGGVGNVDFGLVGGAGARYGGGAGGVRG